MKARVMGLALPVGLALAAAAGAAEGARVPGTPVVMEPPPGFVAETGFAGFGKRDQQASIMVTPFPAPLAQLRAGFTREALAGQGITLLGEEVVAVAGAPATLYHVAQSQLGMDFRKWILPLEHGSSSVLIVGTFPLEEEKALSSPIRQALLGTRLQALEGDPLAGMPFRVQPTAKLKLVTRIGSSLLLSESGQPSADPKQALLVVGPSLSDVDLGDLESFARARVARIAQVRKLVVDTVREVRVDGLRGLEVLGRAEDSKSGTPQVVYQLVLQDGGSYFIAQGLAGQDRGSAFVREFRKVAESLRR
jgi:hypothetical protein